MEARFGSGELLPFWIADTDFPVMPELVQAIEERAAHPSYGYSFASPAYYDSFIRWNRERNHFAVEREQVLSVPGVVCACAFTIYSLVLPGEGDVLQPGVRPLPPQHRGAGQDPGGLLPEGPGRVLHHGF